MERSLLVLLIQSASNKVRINGADTSSNVKAQQFLGQYDQELIELHGGSLSNEDLNVLGAHNGPTVDESE
ncbi:hypothetical protein T10_9504 [Trichinella papuae]|uniref:Uncharacterized protein n=1 Tax=Trichinella papuae TaxID=268474 RepID=A0A0V1M687_9BILA|nr:hypothetical protein T10_1623 [Trichinella papuae]KRZ80371.1 hypothetical protein T10_9504 [Trichinella papuae]